MAPTGAGSGSPTALHCGTPYGCTQTGFAGAAERAERNARERERQELIHAKLKEDRENS